MSTPIFNKIKQVLTHINKVIQELFLGQLEGQEHTKQLFCQKIISNYEQMPARRLVHS